MNWFGWTLVAWWTTAALITVSQIGKPRKPLQPSAAVVGIVIAVALIVGLLSVGTGR